MFKQTKISFCRVVFGQYFLLRRHDSVWVLTRERFNTPAGFAVFSHCVRAGSILGLTELSGINWRASLGSTIFSIQDLQRVVASFD